MRVVPKRLFLVELSIEAANLVAALPVAAYVRQPIAWNELEKFTLRGAPDGVVILEPVDPGSPAVTFSRVQQLRRVIGHPSTLPILAVARHPENTPEIFASLLAAGLTEWIDLGRECSPAALERRLSRITSITVQRLLDRALPGLIPSRTRAVLAQAAEVAASGGRTLDFAEAMGVAERTASFRCARADLPPARRLLSWLRLLQVAAHLDAEGRSLESIARATYYSSAASLKTALRNMFGLTPRELRSKGAFAYASAKFAAELRDIREENRQSSGSAKTWLN
jgi:AraC-like DNA-binding protein